MLNIWADKFVVTTARHTQPLPNLIMSIMTPPPLPPSPVLSPYQQWQRSVDTMKV